MLSKRRVELLAPAGNAEGFYGAIHAGADAVYLGGNRFGARAYAENFTTSELVECIRYGHLLGRKIYLTVNTLLKESELSELSDYLQPFYEAGLDAVIVQDMGVLGFIRRHFPALELHASTQMTLCSLHGARLLKDLGAARIVPARELSLQELSEIRSRVDIELETFIHGAMCYCYSGQCLFSSILGGRSGNRGRCAQPCRLPYEVKTGGKQSGTCYPLSLKDMCTIEHIPMLIEAGIDSFKIEGRMKKPEYAAGVTAIYRKYIDRYYELREQFGEEHAAERYEVLPEDMDALSSLYIRSEKQDGFYFKHNGREMVTLSSPAYSGNNEKLLAEIKARYLDERLKLPVRVAGVFVAGLPAEVTLQTDELSVTVRGATVEKAQKQPVTEENVRKQLGKMGDSAFVPVDMELKVGEEVFYPLRQINELRREAVSKLEQSLLERKVGELQLESKCASQTVMEIRNKSVPQTEEEGQNKQTLPAEPLSQTDTEVRGKSGLWTEGAVQSASSKFSHRELPDGLGTVGIAISVRTLAQLQGVADYSFTQTGYCLKRLYIDGDLLLKRTQETLALCGKLPGKVEFYVALPYILRQKDDIYLRSLSEFLGGTPLFRGVLARSLDGLAYARERGYRNRLDANVYCWNSMALAKLQTMTEGFCLPLELKAGEQRSLLEKCGDSSHNHIFEKTVYGRIPMMVTANCLMKTAGSCRPEDESPVTLIDRYHKEFPVIRVCDHCMNLIYNSVPLSLHQDVGKWREKTDIRLDFTVESGGETVKILEAFLDNGKLPYSEYTTGHEKRGVE